MPLLNIVGITGLGITFHIAFAFVRAKAKQDLTWVLQQFRKGAGGHDDTKVMVTDRDLALMGAIQIIHPNIHNLLCQWHIQKNVLAKCKPHFVGVILSNSEGEAQWVEFQQAWTRVMQASTVRQFEERWQELKDKFYTPQYPAYPACYLKATWLPWKERFVSAWTDKHMHLRTTVTSRVEGAHATLKRYLKVCATLFLLAMY